MLCTAMVDKDKTSADSLIGATRSRASFSGHGGAKGAAGRRERSFDPENCEYLRVPGQSLAVSPGKEGFESMMIGAEWEEKIEEASGFIGKALGLKKERHIDLDLGCFYEMADGTRGVVQAFGKKHGSFKTPPYIELSEDERTGKREGYDEYIMINGVHWGEIKRMVVYLYIYEGAPSWAAINPKVILDVPGEDDLIVTLGVHDKSLPICAVGGLENLRGGIKLTNYTEYFPGHEEMDRAFGFGLDWSDGVKS